MKRNWGGIETLRRCPQSRNPAIILGIPFALSRGINLTVGAIRLERGILDIQVPWRPLLQGPQGYQLQMRRSATDATRSATHATLRRSGSRSPFATNRALAVFALSTSLQVNAQRVSTISLDCAPIFASEKTVNCPHGSNFLPFPSLFAQDPHAHALPPLSIPVSTHGCTLPQPTQIKLAPRRPSQMTPRDPYEPARESFISKRRRRACSLTTSFPDAKAR